MLAIITRIRYPALYERMKESAINNSSLPLEFLSEVDEIGQPEVAKTYNRMGARAKSDYLVFVHDDVVFLEQGWDSKLIEVFEGTDADIVGVVGTDKYTGGTLFRSGFPHTKGKYVTLDDKGEKIVKVSSPALNGPVVAVDHFFMAVRSKFFDANKFDEQFDGLFFSDIDYCLRSKRVYLADILLGHYKPLELRGKYPEGMKSLHDFSDKFHAKHYLEASGEYGDQRVASADMNTYLSLGQDEIFKRFEGKIICGN